MNFAESLALKAVSLLLALILWVTILSLKPEERGLQVAIEPMLPPSMVLVRPIPDVNFTLQGSRIVLNDYQKKLNLQQENITTGEPGKEKTIPVIRVDLSRSRETSFEYQTKDMLADLPKGIKLTSYTPESISVRLEEVIEKLVPVKPILTGVLAEGDEIASIKVTPSKVKVSGARSFVEELVAVETEALDVSDLKDTKKTKLAIKEEKSLGYQITGEKEVQIELTTRRARRKQ